MAAAAAEAAVAQAAVAVVVEEEDAVVNRDGGTLSGVPNAFGNKPLRYCSCAKLTHTHFFLFAKMKASYV